VLLAVPLLLSVFAGSFLAIVEPDIALIPFAVMLGANLLYVPLQQVGAAHAALRAVRSEPVVAAHFFGAARHLLAAAVAMILGSLGVLVGLALLVAPGIILGIGLSLWSCAMVDRRIGPVAALRQSWRLTRGRKAEIFVVYLVFWGANVLLYLASVLCCPLVLPMLILTLPLATAATAVVYSSCANGPRPLSGDGHQDGN
jgi:hypothetical protein